MNSFEKLLLRRAKNNDLKRSAQWLANLAQATVTANPISDELCCDLGQIMEYYGTYAETEDPEALMNAETELVRVVGVTPEGSRDPKESVTG